MDEPFGPTTASLLHQISADASQRAADGSSFIAEQSRLQYLEGKDKLGVREAQAMQEVRTSAQAREILQARAASDQPNKP